MNGLTFRVDRENKDYIKPGIVPVNRAEEPRIGLIDGAIIVFFLLCVSGLISLLLLS